MRTHISKKNALIISLISSLIFALLFYKNQIGLNLLLFNFISLGFLFYVHKPKKLQFLTILVLVAVILSSIMVVTINSSWSIFINILMLLCFSSLIAFKKMRSFINSFGESFTRVFSSQFSIFLPWHKKTNISPNNKASVFAELTFTKLIKIIILPLLIVILFIILYSNASSLFYEKFSFLINFISEILNRIQYDIVLIILLGYVISNILYMKTKPTFFYYFDRKATTKLDETKFTAALSSNNTDIRTLYLSGIILLFLLNLLIFYFNLLDISNIWLNFKWDGSFLKEFVHEGTWILVFCIILSSAIALYFFKSTLNFYKNNKFLKTLTILWLFQNIIMCISVGIRNYWYIQYFGLAYKRIAILFFLLLTIIGIVSIIIKILNKKSSFYLWQLNGISLVLILTISTCFNWDLIIAKHNFKHYDRSLIDYYFMSKLSDSTLPIIYKTHAELEEINKVQEASLPFDIHLPYLWDIYAYQSKVSTRYNNFINEYPDRNFLEWNYADYKAYKSSLPIRTNNTDD